MGARTPAGTSWLCTARYLHVFTLMLIFQTLSKVLINEEKKKYNKSILKY